MSLDEKERFVIPLASPVRSLCWDGDELVDWVSGGVRYSLSGVETRAKVYFPYRFDRAVSSPDGQWAILYEVLGTKALITARERQVRELNRSYYFANAYEYPITVFRLPDGTMALAHCPDEYNKIEIEELVTGRRLTARTCKPQDVFHSRLQISPGGTYLLSAGWVWGSADIIQVFNVRQVLKDPEHLDTWQNIFDDEVYSAAFQTDDVLLLNAENENTESKGRLVGYSLAESRLMFSTLLDFFLGTIMPVGKDSRCRLLRPSKAIREHFRQGDS
jgi:hypothetical protein